MHNNLLLNIIYWSGNLNFVVSRFFTLLTQFSIWKLGPQRYLMAFVTLLSSGISLALIGDTNWTSFLKKPKSIIFLWYGLSFAPWDLNLIEDKNWVFLIFVFHLITYSYTRGSQWGLDLGWRKWNLQTFLLTVFGSLRMALNPVLWRRCFALKRERVVFSTLIDWCPG